MNVGSSGNRVGLGLMATIVAVAATAAYLPAVNAFFVGDDFDFLRVAERIDSLPRAFANSFWGEYMPVFTLSFLLDRAVWGLNPLGYHLTSLLFHALASVFVLLLATTLTRGDRAVGAACALLFAVHPIHDEAVIYIAARGHVMGGACLILALYLHARYRTSGRTAFLVPALIALLVGLFCKETTILAPAFVLAADLLLGEQTLPQRSVGERLRGLALGVLPFATICATYLAFRWLVLDVPDDKVERVASFGWEWSRLPFYLLVEFLPVPTTLLASETVERLAIPSALAMAVAVYLVVRRHVRLDADSRRHQSRVLLYSLAFFAIATLPFLLDALGLRRRYAYLGSFGACLFLATVLVELSRTRHRWTRLLGIGLLLAAVLASAGALVGRASLYASAGQIAQDVSRDLPTMIEPGTKQLRVAVLQLPYRVGGDSFSGAYLFHRTDLRSAIRLFAGVDKVQLDALLELRHADDHAAEAVLWDQGTLFVKMTSSTRAAHRSLVRNVEDEMGPTVLGRMRVQKRDDDTRTVVVQLKLKERLRTPAPDQLVLVYDNGHFRSIHPR